MPLSKLRIAFVISVLAWLPVLAGDSEGFCREHRLDCAEFTSAVASVRQTGRLPEKLITKATARSLGWRPGADLARVAPGKSIGGDRFGNYEKRLPEKKGRQWFEADLGFRRKKRGAKRLLFSSDRLIYITTDHYQTFVEVPR